MEAIDLYTGEIVKVDFFTPRFAPSTITVDKEDHHSMTEQAYVPPQVQIKDMMMAGLRLNEERRARFDSQELGIENDDDIPLDPTREIGGDIVDVMKAGVPAIASVSVAEAARVNAEKEALDAAEKARFDAAVAAAVAAQINPPKA